MKRTHYICTVKDCGKKHMARGFCMGHYFRWRNKQEINTPLKVFDHVFKNTHGYTILYINGKEILEHRHIMEKHIGRKLKRNELVHHKNEDRSDNRLCNLQIITRGNHTSHHHIGKSKPTKNDFNKCIVTLKDWQNRGSAKK